ncbi:MAG: serine/threonine protein kinase [Polyangiaceae bacterium]|nr:serine/threonine protein kinase [Polyangiaceae bacterium]
MATESMIQVGQTLLGKYRVVREIGRGGMAAVYEAEQLSLGKKVAMKILASEMSSSTIVIERFFREARAAASVKSPYIVDVYDSGRLDDGRPFIAMELLEGESLYDRMARVRVIDLETTMRVVVHTARGLVKAHAAGIVHRDLKPENIFLTKGEDSQAICKILDFGLAKFYAPMNPAEKAQKRLTREGAVFGTPAYMSPEQVKGHGNVDHRADLWALGCMAYECLIGRPVWNMDQGVAMTFAAIATGPIPVPSHVRPDLPRSFDLWFGKCLERDPNARFQSASDLADAFIEAWNQGRRSSSQSSPSFITVNSLGLGSPSAPSVPALLASPPPSGRQQPSNHAVDATPRTEAVSRASGASGASGANVGVSVEGDGPVSNGSPPSGMVTSDKEATAVRTKASPLRAAASTVFFAGALSLAGFVWTQFVNPQVFTPIVVSSASAQPSATPSGMPTLASSAEEPKWVPAIGEGQQLFTQGQYEKAQAKFQDAIAIGGAGATVGKSFVEQTKFIEKLNGNCKPAFFSRPRLATDKRAERPAIIATPKGALVTWTDDHEQDKREHVYGVLLDGKGRSIGPIRDLTPEATEAEHPQLITQSADRSVLLWWDAKGSDAGVRVRFLDADGRIDTSKGQSVLVGAARPGTYWPSIDKGPDGSFFVVWQDDRDKDDDLFVRRLTSDLDTASQETRLTDYVSAPKSKQPPPRVRGPSVAVGPSMLLVAYRLDKDRDRSIVRMRVPLADIDKGGLDEAGKDNKISREVGDVATITPLDDNSPVDAPVIACGAEGCFLAWHVENSGAFAAMIDPKEGKVIWRKKLGDKSGHPSLGVNRGQVAVAYYDAGKIKLSVLSRDGVTVPSVLVRVYDPSSPRPSLAGVPDKNEWYLAWQDQESRNAPSEIYAARIVCR